MGMFRSVFQQSSQKRCSCLHDVSSALVLLGVCRESVNREHCDIEAQITTTMTARLLTIFIVYYTPRPYSNA